MQHNREYKKSFKNILVVGSWAKEQIAIENIKKKPGVKVFSYMDTKNPGIATLADDFELGSLSESDRIIDYAKKKKADIVIITTATPLKTGLVDALEKENIFAFGPNRVAAKLETDKAFARGLMQKYNIKAVPKFQIFTDFGPAIEFAKQLNWNVAVKPAGLTEGLGVKVFGDQLKNSRDVIEQIDFVLNSKPGNTKVIIEEKLEGEEFTLQCIVCDSIVIPTPAVQDFKKLLPGDKGANTASMGSYSDTGTLLPFMTQEDYDTAINVIRDTIKAFHSETGLNCRGFLYGQFMLTKQGLKLIEFNFRPGDPEWLDTVVVLKDNILDLIKNALNNKEGLPHFEKKATVCKYIVPMSYPEKLNEVLDISLEEDKIKKNDVGIYYSCGIDDDGKLNVGTERGIALIAKGNTIYEANKKLEKGMAHIKGNFYYRNDIGSRQMIRQKMVHIHEIRNPSPTVRQVAENEFMKIYKFVEKCKPLEHYPAHLYKIMFRYFGSTCFIAELKNKVLGFVIGFISQQHEKTYFLWQIGVDPSKQGKGVGSIILEMVEAEVKKLGCQRIELTIDPENKPSQNLFDRMGYRNVSGREGEQVTVDGNAAIKDYYSPGRHFMLYEKYL